MNKEITSERVKQEVLLYISNLFEQSEKNLFKREKEENKTDEFSRGYVCGLMEMYELIENTDFERNSRDSKE